MKTGSAAVIDGDLGAISWSHSIFWNMKWSESSALWVLRTNEDEEEEVEQLQEVDDSIWRPWNLTNGVRPISST